MAVLRTSSATGLLALAMVLSTQVQAKLTVHEWGTFTSLVGSNGEAQNGMYHEDELLPDFVHNFGDSANAKPKSQLSLLALNKWAWAPPEDSTVPPREANPPILPRPPSPPPVPPRCSGHSKVGCEFLNDQVITQKMETPVVYFYSDVAQLVNFDVSFPGGIISQSYPAATQLSPEAIPGVELKNGFAHYEVNILKNSLATPPLVDRSNIYSHARNVASDLIQIGQETEKFIFYRGIGEFRTNLQVTSKFGGVRIKNGGANKIPAAFLIYTDEKGMGDIISLGELDSLAQVSLSSHTIAKLTATEQPRRAFLSSARLKLFRALTKAGLYSDEALSMINTWNNGYFKTPGLRVLYVLNKSEVDEILPIRVSPQPNELNRVFVGRIEVLLDTVEEKVLAQVIREATKFDVSQLGRLALPILLRVQEVAKSKGILTADLTQTIEQLISQIQ
jgi:hypothetical protein